MLKYSYESKDQIPEGQEQFYREQEGGGYQLAAEGAVSKKALDEFRDKNIELQKEREVLQKEKLDFAEKYKDVDPARYQEMLAAIAKNEENEMIAKGNFNEVMERQRGEFQSDLAKMKEVNNVLTKKYHEEKIDNEIGRLLPDAGLLLDGNIRFVQSDARKKIYLDDHGDFRVKGENGPKLDNDGNPLEVKQWLKDYAINEGASLFASSHGSNAPGNNRPVTPHGRFLHQSQLKGDLSKEQFDKVASGEYTVTG